VAPSAPASSTSTAGGFVQGGVTFAELGRRAGRVAPDDREGPLGDEEQRFSGAVDRQSRLVAIEPDGERAEVACVEAGQVVDPVTERLDPEQRIKDDGRSSAPEYQTPVVAGKAVAELCASAVRVQVLEICSGATPALWSAASRVVAGRRVRRAASAAVRPGSRVSVWICSTSRTSSCRRPVVIG